MEVSVPADVEPGTEVLFFLKGIPPELTLSKRGEFLIAKVAGNATSLVEQLADMNHEFSCFISARPDLPVQVFLFRNPQSEAMEAIRTAHSQMSIILDSYPDG